MAPVGTPPLGAGLWGQIDLAGEVYEWNLDWWAAYVDPWTDSANLTAGSGRVIRGGDFEDGSGFPPSPGPSSGNRYDCVQTLHTFIVGFRCARSP